MTTAADVTAAGESDGWTSNGTVLTAARNGQQPRIVRSEIASLFVGGIDPTVIIRWKDLFERLENAIDSCEKAAHIRGIAVRRA